jgi:hypothetical protein
MWSVVQRLPDHRTADLKPGGVLGWQVGNTVDLLYGR